MRNLLWEIIEKSKEGTNFNSEKQYINLLELLREHEDKCEELETEWYTIAKEMIQTDEYDKLHLSNGGLINGGDDTFYSDFGGWVVAQGKELYDNFMANGNGAIIAYIDENNVSEDNYTYECMTYAFYHIKDI